MKVIPVAVAPKLSLADQSSTLLIGFGRCRSILSEQH